MAVTTQNSDLMVNIAASPPVFNAPNKGKARLVSEVFNFTQAGIGDAGSVIRICQLPQKARLLLMISRIKWQALGAARLMSFGWEAYSKPDGTLVAASTTGLGSALDVSAATASGLGWLNNFVTAPLEDIEFEGSPVLTFSVTGGTIPDTTNIRGAIVYALP